MTLKYRWSTTHETKFKLKNNDPTLLSLDKDVYNDGHRCNPQLEGHLSQVLSTALGYATGNELTKKMASLNVTDYNLDSLTTNIENISPVSREGNFLTGYSWFVTVKGTTIAVFNDVVEAIIAVLEAVGVAIAQSIIAHPWIVVASVSAVVLFHFLSSDLTNLSTGVARAIEVASTGIGSGIQNATSTAGGTILVTIVGVAAAVISIIVVYWLVFKSKLFGDKTEDQGGETDDGSNAVNIS